MTITEFQKIAVELKAMYADPRFLAGEQALELWYELLSDLTYEQAAKAVRSYITTETRTPTVADIRRKAMEFSSGDEMTPLEAWGLVYNAVCNSIYNSKEEFDKLPPIIQKVVGSHDMLREWAMMDLNDVQTVEQSHFIKSYREELVKEKARLSMPENLRKITTFTVGRLSGE